MLFKIKIIKHRRIKIYTDNSFMNNYIFAGSFAQ